MCEFLNETIEGAFDDGSWKAAFDATLGEAGGAEAPTPTVAVDPSASDGHSVTAP